MNVHNVDIEYQLHIYTVGMGTVYQPESASDDPYHNAHRIMQNKYK